MAKRTINNPTARRASPAAARPAASTLLLTISLVPLVIGVLLIAAWALDIEVLSSMENQIVVGTLFLLFSFAASNAIQKKWLIAAGWALVLVADWLVLTQRILGLQIAAGVLGIAGLAIIGYEFFKRIYTGNPNAKPKSR